MSKILRNWTDTPPETSWKLLDKATASRHRRSTPFIFFVNVSIWIETIIVSLYRKRDFIRRKSSALFLGADEEELEPEPELEFEAVVELVSKN